jgi:AraC-like DNA-binding protein
MNNLYDPFEIVVRDLESNHFKKTRNNFFELIHIIGGTGIQTVNKLKFNYRKNNLFLLTPQDTYSFETETKTTFFSLKFDNSFTGEINTKEATHQIKYILQNASHRPGCILKNKNDKPLVALLIESILNEKNNQQIYFSRIIDQLVQTLITIVARNIALKLPKNIKENSGEPVLEMLHYIQDNIFDSKKLRSEVMSKVFNISPSYFGRFFKKQTGESLQTYVNNYKMRLIELRLLNSDMRINEIAYEFNFSDESHLNKAFKKFKGIGPSEYRRKVSC